MCIFSNCRSDTDSGRSSDYREDNPSLNKSLALDFEPNKYFSLPRPKYNAKAEVISPDYEKPKLRVASEAAIEARRGGRRFTVDVASNDVATALADIGIKSRSNTHLNAIYESDMKISTLPNMKLRKEVARECNNNDKRELLGPEFIINSNTIANVIDLTDHKVRYFYGAKEIQLQ